MPDISIALSAQDNYSSTLLKARNVTESSVKSVEGLQKAIDVLNATKFNITTNLDRVKDELKEAKKNFLEFGDAANEAAYKTKQEEFNNLSSSLRAVNTEAKAAERSIQDLAGTNSKISNRSNDAISMMGSLAGAGLGQMVGNSLQTAANTYLSAQFGSERGGMYSTILGSTIEGAAIGSMAGPIGTAVGAGVGFIAGGITADAEVAESRNDAFRSYVQEQTEAAWQEQADTLTSGSSIAGTREATRIAFSHKFGSEEAADAYLDQVREMANKTNYEYDEITGYTKMLLNSYDKDSVLPVLGSLSDATAGLNWNSSDVEQLVSVLNTMRIDDKMSTLQAKQFSSRGLNAYEALAQGLGVDQSQISELLSSGKISGEDASQYIVDYINREYGGLSDVLAGSFEGLMGNLQDTEADLQAAMGAGYNEARKEGLQKQIDFNTGETGDKLQEAYTLMGEFQADLENTREQMQRDAMTAVMDGIMPAENFDNEEILGRLQTMSEEYQKALADSTDPTLGIEEQQKARAEMGALLAEAKVVAENKYNDSTGAEILLNSQRQLAERVAADTAAEDTYWNAGYRLGQTYSKAINKGIQSISILTPNPSEAYTNYFVDTSELGGGSEVYGPPAPNASSSAYGMDYVPYDGFPAILHEGERVLTAQQARQQDAGSGGAGVSVTINMIGATVRQDSDIDELAERVAARLVQAFDTAR